MSAFFPETEFRPAAEHAAAYAGRVRLGRERAAASRLAVCGLARQLGDHLEAFTVPLVEALGGYFADWRAFVVENDSSDGTPDRLRAWSARQPRVTALCERLSLPRWPAVRDGRRGHQMAQARNKYLDLLAADEAARGFDYALVLDTDLVGCSLEGVLAGLGRDEPWDVLAANGVCRHRGHLITYDAWAYRAADSLTPLAARDVNPLVFRRGTALHRVRSAFGGLALYRLPGFLGRRYSGGDCEHVPFHAKFADVFINPDQLTLYPDIP